ncbi:MAG: VTC domain-containing protein [Verrucomicrobia bacterium]|nr:VTC domain-containing protein [Verrucomicrobiota bacterium]
MPASAPSYRYERKFLVPPDSRNSVEPGIRLNPALFSPLYQPRVVNNIYLDSPALGLYFLNLDGAAERTKVRIRWYGNLLGQIAAPVLEFKLKRGLLGSKESYPLKPFYLDNTFASGTLRQVMGESALPANVRQLLSGLEPALLNCYRRKYYRSADRQYRLTVDSRLEFFRLHRSHNALLCKAAHWPFQVVELKYDEAHSAGADAIAAALPFRLTKMSKYVFGVDSLDGY